MGRKEKSESDDEETGREEEEGMLSWTWPRVGLGSSERGGDPSV